MKRLAVLGLLLWPLANLLPVGPERAAWAQAPSFSELTVTDLDDHAVSLGDYPGKVVVLLHEDRDASEQNQDFKTRLGKLSEQHKGHLLVVALADVSVYNFWPARRYVKAALRRLRDEGATVLCDWKGTFRKRFALRSGQSSLFLVYKDQIELTHRGEMTPDQAASLLGRIDRMSN
jgi:hypothetical protein